MSITLQKTSTPTAPPVRPALVQHAFLQHVGTTSVLSFPQAVQSGDLLVVAVTTNQMTVQGVKDQTTDAFHPVTQPLVIDRAFGRHYVELWYASHVSGSATSVTVSFTGPPDLSNSNTDVGIYDYSGLSTTSPLVRGISRMGVGNAPSIEQLPTVQAPYALYFVVGGDDGFDQNNVADNSPVSAGSGFTLEDQQDNREPERFYTEDQITQPTTTSAAFALAVASSWGVICAMFASSY